MRYYFPTALLTFFLLLSTGCREDLDLTVTDTTQDEPTITEGNFSVAGRVTYQDGLPASFVTVELSGTGLTTVTNNDGRYRFRNAPRPVDGAALTFTHENFFPEHRYLHPKSGAEHQLDVAMHRVPITGSVNGDTGGGVPTDNGAVIFISPNSALLDGQPYTGVIEVKLSYINPFTDNFYQSAANFPGERPTQDFPLSLESYGLARVEFTGVGGAPITFSADQGAELLFVSSREVSTQPGSFTALWRLENDRWGPVATDLTVLTSGIIGYLLEGGYYQFATALPAVEICGRLVNDVGRPQPNARVTLRSAGDSDVISFRTDLDGSFCVPVGAGQALTAFIENRCSPGDEQQIDLGPYEVDTEVGDLVTALNIDVFPVFTGTCAQGAVNIRSDLDVYVNGQTGGGRLFQSAEDFTMIELPNCTDGPQYVQIATRNGLLASRLVTRLPGETDITPLIACDLPASNEVFNVSIGAEMATTEFLNFLLLADEGEFRQQLTGRLNTASETDVIVRMNLPLTGPGTYDATNASVEVALGETLEEDIVYRCAGDCGSLTVELLVGDLASGVTSGTFSYVADEIVTATGAVTATNVPVSGTFRINHGF